MTREERIYFYNQLYKLFHDWVEENKGDDLYIKSIALQSFADSYMQTITGQQPLPQEVFRLFLEEYVPILRDIQLKTDDTLKTENKTIVGSINELYGLVAASDVKEILKKIEQVEQLAYAGL
jgi:hypothetical protein